MVVEYRDHAMQEFKRSVYCGKVDKNFLGREISLVGWVNKRRDHGNLIFIDLRDRTGIMQLVLNPEISPQTTELAKEIRAEFVLSVKGKILKRSPEAINKKMKTGLFELEVHDLKILNKSKPLPYQLEDADNVDDELRLKYRYLDLRRKKMFDILKLRHDVTFAIREYLNKEQFYEVETPILSKSTPEGARDFLVPSRLQPGSFYALPQSPQIYKQLLMASGIDKYFQVARCFRDEDFRANRQPEFTQLDMEMSFIYEDDIISICEKLLNYVYKKIFNKPLNLPIERRSYKNVFEQFGTDKPDMRFGLEINDFTKLFKSTELRFLKSIIEEGGKVGGLIVKDQNFSKSELKRWEEFAKNKLNAQGMIYIKFSKENQLPESNIAKFLPTNLLSEARKNNFDVTGADTIFLISGEYKAAWSALGKLRLELAKKFDLIDENKLSLIWVTDFPLFEWNEDEKRWFAMHHPFTAPKGSWGNTKLQDMTARAYDLVANGEELGGGSIRIYDSQMQRKMFETLGINQKEAEEKFGALLEAQELGCPPHGGFAFGLDRLIMTLAKVDSIRDVIAFPKTQTGVCPLMQTPSSVSKKQLKELKIKV